MLKHLYIKNFVLIDELSLDFQKGFSVFTGETGAGKSILIDAMSLLISSKASSSFIRRGCDTAVIEGTFDLHADKHACQVLKDAGFEIEDETTFTRELHAGGKSAARIDHRTVTLALMKDTLKYEMDIHGQRDNAYLLDNTQHLKLLDRYINDPASSEEVKSAYEEYASLVKEKENMLKDVYNQNDMDYFQYEIKEIDSADLKPGEDEELEKKEKSCRTLAESMEKLHAIYDLYDNSLSDSLYELNKLVASLKEDDTIQPIKNTVNDSYYALKDAMESLHQFSEGQDISEEDINAIEERLYTIQKLKRKYGGSIEAVLALRDDLQKKVDAFNNRQAYVSAMDLKIAKAEAAYNKKASALSEKRKQYAAKLDQEVQNILLDLMLPNARFVTDFKEEKQPTAHGSDKVEFLISMNKGTDLSPLSKAASGGELSRLMLGLKCIFTRLQGIQTVIFDEIDTGVSGPVATAIGHKMHDLSRDCQVFSVTHLAQAAACADHHYLVSKGSENDTTVSSVRELSKKEIIDQLALIANGSLTASSRKAAAEMYRRNQA